MTLPRFSLLSCISSSETRIFLLVNLNAPSTSCPNAGSFSTAIVFSASSAPLLLVSSFVGIG